MSTATIAPTANKFVSTHHRINDNDYFDVDEYSYNNEPYVNLRSIRVHIEGKDYTNASTELLDNIKRYIHSQTNVDHINYISERLNHQRWFNTLYHNENLHGAIAPCENKLVLPNDQGHYVPNELIASLLVIDPSQYETNDLDKLTYHPVYKFFGSKKAPRTIHCVHFDILVYILMEAFPKIRADLTRLLTIQIEIAQANNETIERLTDLSKEELIKLLDKAKAKIQKKNDKIDELLKRTDELNEKIDYLISVNEHQSGELHELRTNQHYQLMYSEALEQDNTIIINKLDKLTNTVSGLNASNYDDAKAIHCKWFIYQSESQVEPSYSGPKPDTAIWLYCQIREDSNTDLPDDANIVFKADVVSRSYYESLMKELSKFYIGTHYRHILINYDKATEFIEKLNSLIISKGIHPDIYNIGALRHTLTAIKTQIEIKQKKEAEDAKNKLIRQQIIDSELQYVYAFARYRRMYNKGDDGSLTTELKPERDIYVRTGRDGINQVVLYPSMLVTAKLRDKGDGRNTYEK